MKTIMKQDFHRKTIMKLFDMIVFMISIMVSNFVIIVILTDRADKYTK